ncbi:MAG: C39 family peptidase [Erysipelotrichaceae bacterium]
MNSSKRLKLLFAICFFILVCFAIFIFLHFNFGKEDKQPNNPKPTEVNKPKDNKHEEDKENQEIIIKEPERITMQLDLIQSVQENNYYCVPACVQMILRYHNIEVSQERLATEMNTHPITGSEYIDTAKVLNKYLFNKSEVKGNEPGYRIQTIGINDQNPQIMIDLQQRIKMDIKTGDPILVAINQNILYPKLNIANHMILIIGYDLLEDQIQSYHYIDPSYAVQDEIKKGFKTVSVEALRQAIINNEEPAYIW